MKRRATAVVFAVCTSLLALAAVLVVLNHHAAKRAQRLDDFCLATKIAIEGDRRDLVSSDADTQRAAAKRFWSKDIYHGADSLAYCMDQANVPQVPLACPLTEDENARWKCLADFAAKVEQMLR